MHVSLNFENKEENFTIQSYKPLNYTFKVKCGD